MRNTQDAGPFRFRIWIAGYDHWQPRGLRDVPPMGVALEPAEEGTMSQDEAAQYVEAFNRVALGGRQKIWAVALPVTIRYEGDPRPGEILVLMQDSPAHISPTS